VSGATLLDVSIVSPIWLPVVQEKCGKSAEKVRGMPGVCGVHLVSEKGANGKLSKSLSPEQVMGLYGILPLRVWVCPDAVSGRRPVRRHPVCQYLPPAP
jgi:hypothetical protein